jgi:DNA invertase Pin-like site-specific DNA recombinase
LAAAQRRGIGYVRVSRVNGRSGDSFISPEVQRETIERLAAAKGIRIVAWFEDLDKSGGKWEREGFQASLAMVEGGAAEVVLVAKLTRFARSIADTHKALERLERRPGCGLLCGDLDIDTTTATGKLIRGILAVIAAFELELARENWAVARSTAAANGKFPGALPIGYRRTEDRRVEADPDLAPAVRELFLGRAAGMAYSALAARFIEQTGREIDPGSVDGFLANRSYLGELRAGPLKLEVEPIVTEAEFRAAQRTRRLNAPRTARGSLLAGILHCGSCGRPMSFRGGKAGQYTCQRAGKGWACAAPVLIAGAAVDAHVEAAFLERHAASGARGVPDAGGLGEAERERDRARADLAATLALDLAQSRPDLLEEVLEAKAAAVAAAEARVEELQAEAGLARRLTNVGATWPGLGLEERRQLLAEAVERVTVHRSERRVPVAERTEIAFAGA